VWPCQGFSIQRIGDDRDDRNDLIVEFARLVHEFQPRMYLMENVPGLLGRRGRALTMEFVDRMRAARYETAYEVLNAAEYGVPQVRKRVFFCGWRQDLPPFNFPSPIRTPEEFLSVWERQDEQHLQPDTRVQCHLGGSA
jgi:DNA (cytosine-5)-methyltransferase 1